MAQISTKNPLLAQRVGIIVVCGAYLETLEVPAEVFTGAVCVASGAKISPLIVKTSVALLALL